MIADAITIAALRVDPASRLFGRPQLRAILGRRIARKNGWRARRATPSRLALPIID